MNYSHPTRYDISDPNSEMVRHPQGDYVLYDDYYELLEAYQQALSDLVEIADEAERVTHKQQGRGTK